MKLSILALMLAQSVAFAADKPTPPVATKDAKERVATCRDGAEYWSTSTSHAGACRGHGGVSEWADGSPVRSKAERKGEYR